MKKVVRRPLKVIGAAMFMVALGYGISTNSEVFESGKISNVNLPALSSVAAQGEEEIAEVANANGSARRYRCSGFLFFGRRTGLDCMARNEYNCIPRACD